MTSLIGIIALPLIALAFSSNWRAVRIRTVGLAFSLQAMIGGIALFTDWGYAALKTASEYVGVLLGYSQKGISFMFGGLVGSDSIGFVFAFNVLPVVIFFSSLIAVLYHIGVMQWVVRIMGGALRRLLRTSHTESLSAAANVFVGQAEAPLVAQPYIAGMTTSELFAIMVGGMASIAGSVMAGYVALGIPLEYLLAASFMAAPGGLLMAKLLEPETHRPVEPEADDSVSAEGYVNVVDAAATGAMNGMQMAAAIAAMLIAFIALIAMINGIFGWVGGLFGFADLTLEGMLGTLFQPLAFILGVPWEEADLAGSLIGQKLVLNEFVAYVAYMDIADSFSPTAQAVVIFALCGFANLSSIAILLGGLGAVAPMRRDEISRFGFRALLAATLSNLMSAALAGFFVSLAA
ncbi:NupC protein [Luminiphilus syltensis NOR5-1B]|uniref:Nucleoside permease n=1 Tax=Luminiphilus syltensis NOR5-1B TaxID=565045 RepID=B8KWM2_9GAMM|nr:NupC/NupG family nucleoside CNT transporter [Luminiphilus syltensis]EED35230.1 NupC protein [Luminiphilus syltensis NOR5-1B]